MIAYPGSSKIYAHSMFLHRCDLFQSEAESKDHECNLGSIQYWFLVLFKCPYEQNKKSDEAAQYLRGADIMSVQWTYFRYSSTDRIAGTFSLSKVVSGLLI